MAKLAFSKLNLKEKKDVIPCVINNIDGIEIKQYLPINDKLTLIENVINQANSSDANNFINPAKLDMFLNLEIIFNYTNLTFTDKQKEDLVKLYDILKSNDVIADVTDCIPDEELDDLKAYTYDCIESIYDYKNSVRGILEDLGQNYDQLNFDVDTLREKLADSNSLELLKGIMKELG